MGPVSVSPGRMGETEQTGTEVMNNELIHDPKVAEQVSVDSVLTHVFKKTKVSVYFD